MSYARFTVSLSFMDGERNLETLRQQVEAALRATIRNAPDAGFDVEIEVEPVESAGVAFTKPPRRQGNGP